VGQGGAEQSAPGAPIVPFRGSRHAESRPQGIVGCDWTGWPSVLESRALRGAVAQLGERRVRNAKVEGSIPFRSTNLPNKINNLRIAD
jgi:hypothetical protein